MTKEQEKRANKYINSVRKSIKRDYGSIPPEFEAQLDQLRDLYITYITASDNFMEKTETVQMINNGKTPVINFNF